MPVTAAGRAITKETDGYAVFVSHLERHCNSSRHGDVIAEHADEGDEVVLHVAHMHIAVSTACSAGLSGHVLSKNCPHGHAADKERTHVAMRRADDVFFTQIDTATNGNCLLTASDIN